MMNEWALDYNHGRIVRNDASDYAPCGCIGAEQRVFMPYGMGDHDFGVIGCVRCGATWEQCEGHDWEYFNE